MFRVLLTAYVTIVMLAGPSACCCTTGRAVAECFAGDAAEAGRPACCCGHHAPAGDDAERQTAADADGERPGDVPHKCPCRENKTHAVAEARKQVAELQQLRPPVPVPSTLPVAGSVVSDDSVASPPAQRPNRASHLGSAREILRALQVYLI